MPVAIACLTFAWCALCSSPRQSRDPDEGMLANLLLWSYISLALGIIPLALLNVFFTSLFGVEVAGTEWHDRYLSVQPFCATGCVVALELLGAQLALARVARKRREQA